MFQLQCEPVSSTFQHRHDPVSYVSQHQSELCVQRETRISTVTDSHKLDQLHPIVKRFKGLVIPPHIMKRFKGLVTPQNPL